MTPLDLLKHGDTWTAGVDSTWPGLEARVHVTAALAQGYGAPSEIA
jgi:hypothetical protein